MSCNYLKLHNQFRDIWFEVERPFHTNLIIDVMKANSWDLLGENPDQYRTFDPLSERTKAFRKELSRALISSAVAMQRTAQASSEDQELDCLKEAVRTSMHAREILQQGGFIEHAKAAGNIHRTLLKRYAILEGQLRGGRAPPAPHEVQTYKPDLSP